MVCFLMMVMVFGLVFMFGKIGIELWRKMCVGCVRVGGWLLWYVSCCVDVIGCL